LALVDWYRLAVGTASITLQHSWQNIDRMRKI
jgi:hypothetical protein